MPPNEPSGLLSKVVKFVRNPTTNWSDLDQPGLDKESAHSKQMLKEMIERKRRNDFVRRREFDQLRKLRQNEGNTTRDVDVVERPSFFQTSTQSKLEDRAGTIKKIDEIEAQMSRQWWKAKDAGAGPPVPLSSRASLVSSNPATEPSALASGRAYAPTVPASLPLSTVAGGVDGFAPTDVQPMRSAASGALPFAVEPVVDMLADLSLQLDLALPELQEPLDFVHDPALDEAAIRFANGDVAGAEDALKAMLLVDPVPPAASEVWLALFDLYRATGQQDGFDTVGIDFATRFGRSGPAWFSIPDQAGQAAVAEPPPVIDATLRWACPSVLSAAAVAGLQATLRAREPSAIDVAWTRLLEVEEAAVEPLAALFSTWANQVVVLGFSDAGRLDAVLAGFTRAGDAAAPGVWWQLRLAFLRILHGRDAFEMAALEYCITYEVSPPPWQDVYCTYVVRDGTEGALAGAALVEPAGEVLEFKESTTELPASAYTSVLSGWVQGDAADALAKVVRPTDGTGVLVVPCDHLTRIDFSAAGSVLNWAVLQQAEGFSVRFTGLHRLAAIFFDIVGIGEHAKIIPRRN